MTTDELDRLATTHQRLPLNTMEPDPAGQAAFCPFCAEHRPDEDPRWPCETARLVAAAREPLDAAWREAEAALPEGWRIRSLIETPGPKVGWEVVATDSRRIQLARGSSPAAALHALAEALRKPVTA